MKVVEALVASEDADVIDAHLAFQLNAGIDFVVAADFEAGDGTTDVLESYVRDGVVRRVPVPAGSQRSGLQQGMVSLAVAECGATWVVSGEPDEFWWPRAASLKEILSVIPPRYSVVQALVRVFPPGPGDDEPFAERMTVRSSLLAPAATAEALPRALRSVLSARAVGVESNHVVPLRAWYPVELLRFPLRTAEQAERRFMSGADARDSRSALEDSAAAMVERGVLREQWNELVVAPQAAGVEDGLLAVDERLRDRLRALRSQGSLTSLRPPSVVDDAAYAVECTAVGEVDLERVSAHIQELENRITRLEQRPLGRVRRRLRRLTRE